MLSDPNSEIIRQFEIFNDTISETDARQYGIPHPGTFLVDEQGIVRHKFFEEKYVHRVTMATISPTASGSRPPRAHRASRRTTRPSPSPPRRIASGPGIALP